MSAIPAVRLPHVRDKLASFWRSDFLTGMFADPSTPLRVNLPGADWGEPDVFARNGTAAPVEAVRSFGNRTADALEGADLYWVSAEFSRLAADAGDKLPDLTFLPEELPSPSGLVVWQHPIGVLPGGARERDGVAATIDVTAASWFTLERGVWITLYCNAYQAMPGAQPHWIKAMIGALHPVAPGGGAEFGRYPRTAMHSDMGITARLLATWFLLAQPDVADTTTGPVDRQMRKKYDRAKRPWPQVRVINLRRAPTADTVSAPPDSDEESSPAPGATPRREATHQSIVGSHWRTYWTGPGRTVRQRHYIQQHLRRPDLPPGPPPPPTVKTLR